MVVITLRAASGPLRPAELGISDKAFSPSHCRKVMPTP
jgi:hypothetical protein